MKSLPHVAAFCAIPDPYLPAHQSEPMFHDAMLELTRYHAQHTPGYANWLQLSGQSVESLAASRDWRAFQPIHTSYFKRHLPQSNETLPATELHSSGTSGQKSRMRYDDHALQSLMAMSDRIFDHYGWNTPQQACNYVLLSYEPEPFPDSVGNMAGNARTNQFLCKYAPIAQAAYALRATGRAGASHAFDSYGVIRSLQAFAEEGLPVRILGFPSFLWFVLERMRDLCIAPLNLHPDSLVLTGGGWKMHAAQAISKTVMHQRLGEQLGIPAERCRDGYGAVEHGIPYIECAHHRFHVPTYARAYVIDPRTGHVMQGTDDGEPGLLQLQAPYLMSSPAHSVLPGDLATLMPAGECRCGLPTGSFVIHGRAGSGKQRNCALAAAELIKEPRP